jgi:hypothetical protein
VEEQRSQFRAIRDCSSGVTIHRNFYAAQTSWRRLHVVNNVTSCFIFSGTQNCALVSGQVLAKAIVSSPYPYSVPGGSWQEANGHAYTLTALTVSCTSGKELIRECVRKHSAADIEQPLTLQSSRAILVVSYQRRRVL